jgi:uncharacterized repeat protein (TIGR01451 family)
MQKEPDVRHKRLAFLLAATLLAVTRTPASATALTALNEGFDDITAIPGWFVQNNSSPIGSTTWFQGNATVFPSHAGATTAYVGANFNSTAGAGTISNWLLTPELSVHNGDVFSFWTRTTSAPQYPDRLEVRLSTNGASTNVGADASGVGDFTAVLLSVNPTLTTSGYPNVWTQYTVTLSGVPAAATGRIAFRYFVTGGGPTGTNSDYIGIDTVSFTAASSGADLALTASANPTAAVFGQTALVTLGATNNGAAAVTNAVVTLSLPAGLSYLGNTCGASYAAPTLTWNIGALTVAGAASCGVSVSPNAAGIHSASASIASEASDPNPANNTAAANITGSLTGSIVDDNASFALNSSSFDASPAADFKGVSPTLAQDHVFETGWWFRVAGDPQETFFPLPTSGSGTADALTYDWADVGGRGLFSARLVWTVTDRDGLGGPAPGGKVAGALTVTNIGVADLTLNLFTMTDFDLQPAVGDDTATLRSPVQIALADAGTNKAAFVGIDADAYLVRPFGTTDVGAVLSDASVTDFDSTGLPFGPADFTGGWQWKNRVIPAGGSLTATVVIAVNVKRHPASRVLRSFVSGDFDGNDLSDLVGLSPTGKIWHTEDLATWTNIPGTIAKLIPGDFNGDGDDEAAGLSAAGKVWLTDGTTWTNIPGTLTTLVGGDFNGDGAADLAGLNSLGKIWYTTDKATWVNVPGTLAQLVAGDFDGDGIDDFAGLSAAGKLWYTLDKATWTNFPGTIAQLISGDFDGDGQDDLAGLSAAGKIWQTTDLATWSNLAPSVTLTKIVSVNIDGDEKDEVAGLDGAGVAGYHAGGGTWAAVPGVSLATLTVGDFDGDFNDDLVGLTAAGKIWFTANRTDWVQVPGTLAP